MQLCTFNKCSNTTVGLKRWGGKSAVLVSGILRQTGKVNEQTDECSMLLSSGAPSVPLRAPGPWRPAPLLPVGDAAPAPQLLAKAPY